MNCKIMEGDALTMLKTLPDESVNCCVTSPPYWGLRSYGTEPQIWGGDPACEHQFDIQKIPDLTGGLESISGNAKSQPHAKDRVCGVCGAWRGELGSEPTPDLFVEHLVMVFREVRRVLRNDGTAWANMGDSYNSPGPSNHGKSNVVHRGTDRESWSQPDTKRVDGLKPKDLIGIPWMLAFAFRSDGWYLRSEIIWAKRNCMPESVRDRPTKSHEQIFLLAKSQTYYYDADAIMEPIAESTKRDTRMQDDYYEAGRVDRGYPGSPSKSAGMLKRKSWHGSDFHDGENLEVHSNVGRNRGDKPIHGNLPGRDDKGANCNNPEQESRNKRDVWTVNSAPFKDAHFATFPPDLIKPCILAGCPVGGTVLDPFGGSGTTGMVAESLGRNSILIELNPKYCAMIRKRTAQTGMAL